MPILQKNIISAFALAVATSAAAQHAATSVVGRVVDAQTKQPLVGAVVRVTGKVSRTAITDAQGRFAVSATVGAEAEISYMGYTSKRLKLTPDGSYSLTPKAHQLGNVVVTATESHSLTSASNIARHAMQHLQPSSFADVLELLPGGMARDPQLSSPNTIHLREVAISSSDYQTSALGTAFMIDGARMSTNANMQYVAGATDSRAQSRDFVNQGVDMRSISTDDIERVEVVRGIPSVEYGDLTSGLVKITRKRGGHNLSARFKADMSTKLFYVAKGLEWKPKNLSLNLSADYLINHADPRNVLENYSRLSVSARLYQKRKMRRYDAAWGLNADYGGSFDKDKVDPELNYGGVDRFSQSYNRFSTDASWTMTARRNARVWLKTVDLTASFSVENDRTSRTRLVQLDRETPAATSREEGEHDAVLITPYTYTATQTVEGVPVSAYVKASATIAPPTPRLTDVSLKIGADWQFDKNYGEGQKFNPLQPLYPSSSLRPRTYRSIPASHQTGAFAEIRMARSLGNFRLDMQGGVRASSLLHLPDNYQLHGKLYADPRLNAALTLPPLEISGRDLTLRLMGGVGQHTKMPTLNQLFPDRAYLDLVELNYYHSVKEYRRVVLQTYVIDPTNYSLRAARNLKWEVGIDASWWGNRLTLTYFKENMTSGFRDMLIYAPYSYKKYDASGIDANALAGQPDIALLPYETQTDLRAYYRTGNGSQELKRGVEFTLSTRRVPVVNTRLTVTGAWFRTEYRNSQAVMERPSRVVDGQQVNVVGVYRDDDGYIREMTNTNFTFDTDIPRLRLGISLSAQCVWLTANQSMPKENRPIQYMDASGVLHDFTEADAENPALSFLVRTYNSSLYERQTVPFSMNVNLKATKRLMNDRMMLALFVNKLWDAHPDYVRNNFKIRRYVTPYFGLEVNLNF